MNSTIIHRLFELVAFAIAFRTYWLLRRHQGDAIPDRTRWILLAAAAAGAFVGSKLLALLSDPDILLHGSMSARLGGEALVGALFGGWGGVEIAKRALGETRRVGDLYAIPLCVGIAIARLGCYMTGLDDVSYGLATTWPIGVDFGDGITRHAVQLYEIVFVTLLAVALWRLSRLPDLEHGALFRIFMMGYLAWRLIIDSIKPGEHLVGLTATQWLSLAGLAFLFGERMMIYLRGMTPDGQQPPNR